MTSLFYGLQCVLEKKGGEGKSIYDTTKRQSKTRPDTARPDKRRHYTEKKSKRRQEQNKTGHDERTTPHVTTNKANTRLDITRQHKAKTWPIPEHSLGWRERNALREGGVKLDKGKGKTRQDKIS
jgi:hypothetical protein